MKFIITVLLITASLFSGEGQQGITRIISVIGTGEAALRPNMAIINIGATYTDVNLSNAMRQTNKALSTLYKVCKGLSIDTNDIQTNNLSVNSDYDYSERGGRKFRGYQVSSSYSIIVRNIKLIDSLISMLSSTGVNEVSSLRFDYDKKEAVKDSLMLVAIDKAKITAEKMAKRSGMKLGKPVKINNPFFDNMVPRDNVSFSRMAVAESSTIAPGSLTIQTSVIVEFELLE